MVGQIYQTEPQLNKANFFILKVSKGAKISDRYNQVPGYQRESNKKKQLDTTNESQGVSPFPEVITRHK